MVDPVARLVPSSRDEDHRATALTALFYAQYGRLVRTARLLVDDRETAEDVVMEAFMSLHRRWHTLRQPGDADRYLLTCVVNGARTQLRRRRVRRVHEGTSRDAHGVSDPTDAGATRAALMHSLRNLPTRQRQVLVMRFYLDLPEAEVAEQLGISIGSVKQHSSRGLAALARSMEVHR
jgi:RNA polymerase sigma-70 factor, sigma-E family